MLERRGSRPLLAAFGAVVLLIGGSASAAVTASTELFVAAAAHAEGSGGSFFATDVRIHDPGPVEAQVAIYDLPAGMDNTAVEPFVVTVGPGATQAFDDIVDSLFHRSGAGGLRFVSDQPIVVTSRTYNRTESGSFSQFIPARTRGEGFVQGDVARIVQASKSESFRTNVGFLDVDGFGGAVHLSIHSGDGTNLGETDVQVPPYGFSQLEPFAALGLTDVEPAMIELRIDGGRVLAYGSLIDASTNDPSFVEPAIVHWSNGVVGGEADVSASAKVAFRNFIELRFAGDTLDQISSWDQVYEGARADTTGCTGLLDLSSVAGLGIPVGADGSFSAELTGTAENLTLSGRVSPDGHATGEFTVTVTAGSCLGTFSGSWMGRLE